MAASRFNGKLHSTEGKTPFLIGVAGGTASGKSTVCKRIMEKLGQVDVDHTERQVVTISQDSFYRELSPQDKTRALKGQYNFDHPDAFNNELIYQTLQDILAGKKCQIPVYDYRTNSRIDDQYTTIYPADVVLIEGILVFYFPEIRDLFHMKLFVDTDSDTRLARRVPRDIKEHGRELDQVLTHYMNFVKPAFEDFCLPTKKFADVIIPRGADNTGDPVRIAGCPSNTYTCRFPGMHGVMENAGIDVSVPKVTILKEMVKTESYVAIELIVQHIRDLLNKRVRPDHHELPSPSHATGQSRLH